MWLMYLDEVLCSYYVMMSMEYIASLVSWPSDTVIWDQARHSSGIYGVMGVIQLWKKAFFLLLFLFQNWTFILTIFIVIVIFFLNLFDLFNLFYLFIFLGDEVFDGAETPKHIVVLLCHKLKPVASDSAGNHMPKGWAELQYMCTCCVTLPFSSPLQPYELLCFPSFPFLPPSACHPSLFLVSLQLQRPPPFCIDVSCVSTCVHLCFCEDMSVCVPQ